MCDRTCLDCDWHQHELLVSVRVAHHHAAAALQICLIPFGKVCPCLQHNGWVPAGPYHRGFDGRQVPGVFFMCTLVKNACLFSFDKRLDFDATPPFHPSASLIQPIHAYPCSASCPCHSSSLMSGPDSAQGAINRPSEIEMAAACQRQVP